MNEVANRIKQSYNEDWQVKIFFKNRYDLLTTT